MRKISVICLFIAFMLCGSLAYAGSISKGKIVTLKYTLFDGNKVLETTRGRKKPFIYVHGQYQLFKALEDELEGMMVGQKKSVVLKPKEAYGKKRKDFLVSIPKEKLPEGALEVGSKLEVKDSKNNFVTCVIDRINKDTVVVDFNHPLAGKTLRYRVEVIGIKDRREFR